MSRRSMAQLNSHEDFSKEKSQDSERNFNSSRRIRDLSKSNSRSPSPPSRHRQGALRNQNGNRSNSRSRSRSPETWHHDKSEKSQWKNEGSIEQFVTFQSKEQKSQKKLYQSKAAYWGQSSWEQAQNITARSLRDPNIDIVVQGLPLTMTESRVKQRIQELGGNVQSVRIIKDRTTGLSRGFGFARFNTIEESQMWIEYNFPSIIIDGTRANVDFSNSKPLDGEPWICYQCGFDNRKTREVCFRCGIPKPAQVDVSAVNDGTGDVGDIPNTVLLIRGLDSLTEEEKIYDQLKVTGHLEEIRLIKDRLTNVSWGFAFAIFKAVPHAAAIITQALQSGFVIDNAQVSLSYAHLSSFVAGIPNSQYSKTYRDPQNGMEVAIMYWDQRAYASIYPKAPTEEEIPAEKIQPKKITTESKKLNIDAELAALNDFFESENHASDNPTEQSVNVEYELDKLESQEKKKKAPKKVQMQLAKWQEKQNQLTQVLDDNEPEPVAISDEELMKKIPTDLEINQQNQDLNSILCLLCQRKFGDVNTLAKHQKKSDLHKTSLAKFKEDKLVELRVQSQNEIRQYRNRAAERRHLYGQPKRPQHGVKREREVVREEPTKDGIGESNIGNKMLRSMGWKEGEGLGRDRSGIVNPIEAEVYAKGVGLGASAPSSTASVYTDVKYSERVARLMNLSHGQDSMGNQ
ncbi:hypothetical protein HK096_010191 [Nowakowskiella sp. JEL0078]|nr:hypothetical protein HK096_010191 [Nowakowskiella sp. JEL0078]